MFTASLESLRANARRLHATFGTLLELGPGRVFPGLEWAGEEPDLDLVGVGYAEAERAEALAQAARLGVGARAVYPAAQDLPLPLAAKSVDAVVSFGAVHRWREPMRMLDEVARVLKPGGKFFFGDVRRDAGLVQAALRSALGPNRIKNVYQDRRQALTPDQARELFEHSRLTGWSLQVQGPDWWIIGA